MMRGWAATLFFLGATVDTTVHAASIRPIGPEFVVVEGSYYVNGFEIDLAGDEFGNFVIVWEGDDYQIHGVRLSASNAAGAPFAVGDGGDEYDYLPRIAMRPSGDFVVAWGASSTYTEQIRPVARRFDRSGAPQGDV